MRKSYLFSRIEKYVLFCFFIFLPLSSYGQIEIRGKVTDSQSSQPLAGVTVVVKGSIVGTLTGMAGDSTGTVPDDRSRLALSYIAYRTKEGTVGTVRGINVAREAVVLRLEEVGVIGYGTAKKSDLTGSVVS